MSHRRSVLVLLLTCDGLHCYYCNLSRPFGIIIFVLSHSTSLCPAFGCSMNQGGEYDESSKQAYYAPEGQDEQSYADPDFALCDKTT